LNANDNKQCQKQPGEQSTCKLVHTHSNLGVNNNLRMCYKHIPNIHLT